MATTRKTEYENDALISLILPLLNSGFDPSDLSEVAEKLAGSITLTQSLDEIDLWDVEPAFKFDPTWHE